MKSKREVHPVLHLDGDDTLHITQRNTGVWYYQRRIPICSQPFYKGKKQFKKSLKTKDKREACILARRLSSELDAEFKKHQALLSLNTQCSTSDSFEILEQQATLKRLETLAKLGANNYLGFQSAMLDPLMSNEDSEAAYYAFSDSMDNFYESESRIRNNKNLNPYDLHQTMTWRAFEGRFATRIRQPH